MFLHEGLLVPKQIIANNRCYAWYETKMEIFLKHMDYSISIYIPQLSMREWHSSFLQLLPCFFGECMGGGRGNLNFGTVQSCIFCYVCNLTYLTSNRKITEMYIATFYFFSTKLLTLLQLPGTVIHLEICSKLREKWDVELFLYP